MDGLRSSRRNLAQLEASDSRPRRQPKIKLARGSPRVSSLTLFEVAHSSHRLLILAPFGPQRGHLPKPRAEPWVAMAGPCSANPNGGSLPVAAACVDF